MEGNKSKRPIDDDDEAIPIGPDEMCNDDEIFSRTLVGKLWTETPYNTRAFKQTILQAWRARNPVEIQDLNKNLFLFKFTSKREADLVCKNGPWSFDRNILVLNRISGTEQPSELAMNRSSFWVRVYDLPLKLRSEAMAQKLGNILGVFEEMNMKEINRMGKFLRMRTSLDLTKPLKRGSKLHFQGKDIWVDYKYERLPNFCFVCGRIGHQMRDCEDIEDHDQEGFSEVEEKDQAFGSWLRASPLPKITFEASKESGSSGCSKNLFPAQSISKGQNSGTAMEKDEEVEQPKEPNVEQNKKKIIDGSNTDGIAKVGVLVPIIQGDVEGVAESLGAVSISALPVLNGAEKQPKEGKGRKWVRQKGDKTRKHQSAKKVAKELGKRSLVDVLITEGPLETGWGADKRKKGDAEMEDQIESSGTVVLDVQHRPSP